MVVLTWMQMEQPKLFRNTPASALVLSTLRSSPYVRALNLEEDVPCEDLLSNQLIGLYFAASWCPPCQLFSGVLVQQYKAIKEHFGHWSFEILLIPRDHTEEAWRTYTENMPWLLVKYSDQVGFRLKDLFDVVSLPLLLIIDSQGELIHENARGGRGFGFGCDGVEAFKFFMGLANKPIREKQDPVSPKSGARSSINKALTHEDDGERVSPKGSVRKLSSLRKDVKKSERP